MMLVTMVATGGASLFGQSGVTTSTVDAVRRELLQLPYYTVFDFLAFKCEGATVTLMGYASTPMLGIDAERAVRRVAGVDAIEDKIELLPLSLDDDNLRWNLYYTIYRDPFLSRYAPGEGRLWGHTHTFPRDQLLAFGPIRFLGTEPAGDYPIHIIVSRGHVTLLGVVESDGDKRRAGVLAQGVSGSLEVENELTIDAPVRETDPRT
jgi:osmotically-inducible protein OsmY